MRTRAPHLPRPSLDDLEAWFRAQPLHCAYLGEPVTLDDAQVDHIVPLDRGGTHDLANLCLTSPKANRMKGAMTGCEFHMLLALISTWSDEGAALKSALNRSSNIFGQKRKR